MLDNRPREVDIDMIGLLHDLAALAEIELQKTQPTKTDLLVTLKPSIMASNGSLQLHTRSGGANTIPNQTCVDKPLFRV